MAGGRPRGIFGECARALLAAAEDGPGTARELSARAQVAWGVGAYTCTRLVAAGQLQKLTEQRPQRLALPAPDTGAEAGAELLARVMLASWRPTTPAPDADIAAHV